MQPHQRAVGPALGARALKAHPRILFDVTYTRLQRQAVGITRTVMRLAAELREIAQREGASFVCVAFDGHGFREVPAPSASPRPPLEQAPILTLAIGILKPAIEQLLRLPWPLIRPMWASASGLAFRQAVSSYPRIEFRDDDVLLLFDAALNYPVDRAVARARRAGAAVVSMLYDLMPIQEPQFCVPWLRSAFADWLARAVQGCDGIVCDSQFTLDSLRDEARRRGWTLPPTSVLRLGCDISPAGAGPVRASLSGFLQQSFCYACVGSFEPKKNHAAVIDAFEQAWARGSAAQLVVVGRRTGECEQVIARLAAHAAAGRVMVVDDANDAEVAHVYGHCRALIVASLFEGFGLPLVEARARGCAVFASDLPAFREIADEGVHWFDPRRPEELARLLMADGAGEVALSRSPMPAFEWRDSALQCLRLVQELLPARFPAAPDENAGGHAVSLAGSWNP